MCFLVYTEKKGHLSCMHVYTAAAKGQKKEMTGGLNMGGKEARDVRLNRQTDEHCSGGKASSVGRD